MFHSQDRHHQHLCFNVKSLVNVFVRWFIWHRVSKRDFMFILEKMQTFQTYRLHQLCKYSNFYENMFQRHSLLPDSILDPKHIIKTKRRREFKKSEYATVQNLLKNYPLKPKIWFLLHFHVTILRSQGTSWRTRRTQWRRPCIECILYGFNIKAF